MIRKILLITVFSFVVFWFAGAYLLKGKLIGMLENIQNDNIKIQYKDASISGFPLNWQITLDHPKISFSNHIGEYEFAGENLEFTFCFFMKHTLVNAGHKFYLIRYPSIAESSEEVGELDSNKHYISTASDVLINLDTHDRVYEIDDRQGAFWDILNSLSFSQDKVKVSRDESDIFELSDLKIIIEKKEFSSSEEESKQDKFNIKLRGKYNSDTNYFQIKSSMIEANFSYIVNEGPDGVKSYGYDRLLNINKLHMDFDEAFLDIVGKIELFKSKQAEGDLRLKMKKYSTLIDILVPENFIIPKQYITKTITKAIISTEGNKILDDQVSLDLNFSETGLKIGKLSLSAGSGD